MLNVKLKPGRYVVAVSGGLDSMVLLDILRRDAQLHLVVAHANHGQRADADQDQALVAAYAKRHGLTFVVEKLRLPARASEAAARTARYAFLQHVCKIHAAQAIVTAHHQNDLIETVLLNYIRGTGWRGLAPFVLQITIARPLLAYTKDDLLGYARRNGVLWREDSTNTDQTYTRNYIRHTLIPFLHQKSGTWQHELLQRVRKQQLLRRKIEANLQQLVKNATLSRHTLIMLPPVVAYELLQQLAMQQTGTTLQRALCEQLLLFAKTGLPGKTMPLGKKVSARLTAKQLIVEPSHSW